MNNQAQMQLDPWRALRESFMRLGLPWRMGELAVSLSRVRSSAEHRERQQDVKRFLDECAHFSEWLTPDMQPHWQADLAELKQVLTDWLAHWPSIWENVEQRGLVTTQAGIWSDKFLQHSGLLDPEVNPR